jgi:hypothetical protein
MKKGILLLIILLSIKGMAQHCPWDCAGMIMLETDLAKEKIEHLNLVLVDENYKEVVDTVYGTGKETYDYCIFLELDPFTEYRKGKIAVLHWYAYDTTYAFANGNYIVKYNYCKYRNKKLYIRYLDQYNRALVFHYIEIPDGKRIHLHDYNKELIGRENEEIRKDVKPKVMTLDSGVIFFR